MKRGASKGIWGEEGMPLELEAISFNFQEKENLLNISMTHDSIGNL